MAETASKVGAFRAAVAGVGNWLIGADRVGPAVMAALRGRLDNDVQLCDVGSAGLGLLDHLHGQELLVVVDACIDGARPGQVRVSDLGAESLPNGGCSVHQVGPIESLAVMQLLHPERVPERCRLVTVETGGLDPAREEDACREAVAAVMREIATWRHDRDGRERRAEPGNGGGRVHH